MTRTMFSGTFQSSPLPIVVLSDLCPARTSLPISVQQRRPFRSASSNYIPFQQRNYESFGKSNNKLSSNNVHRIYQRSHCPNHPATTSSKSIKNVIVRIIQQQHPPNLSTSTATITITLLYGPTSSNV